MVKIAANKLFLLDLGPNRHQHSTVYNEGVSRGSFCSSDLMNVTNCTPTWFQVKKKLCQEGRPGKKHFFVNSEILGIQICQKETCKFRQICNCDKTVQIKYLFEMHSFSSFWQVLHDITMLLTVYLHILHHLQAMKITFLKLFLICMFKDPSLAEK